MKQNVYDFTKDTIKKFQEVGADIGMVQVGNEITNGMLDIMPDYSKGENNFFKREEIIGKLGSEVFPESMP